MRANDGFHRSSATAVARLLVIAVLGLGALAALAAEPAGAAAQASPPSAPTISSSSYGNGTVTINWSTPGNNGSAITGYRVYRGTTSTSLTQIASLGVTNTFTNTGLTNGTTYFYKVAAVNSKGVGAQSLAVSRTPSTTASAPTMSTPTASPGAVGLAWTTPADGGAAITGYKIYRGSSSGSMSLLTSVGLVNSFTNTGLSNGSTYYYRVTALNVNGEGATSAVVNATPSTIPSQATLGTPTAGNGTVTLTWTAPANGGSAITGYNVYRGTTTSVTLIAELGVTTSFTNTGLTNGTTYHYTVAAKNVNGLGAQSAIKTATPSGPPDAPILGEPVPATGKLTLTWSTPANNGAAITGYKVYRGTSASSMSLVATVGVTNTYANTGLTNGTTYHYAVAAVNAKGTGPQSTSVSGVPTPPPSAPSIWVDATDDTTVDLDWNAPSGVVGGYKIYQGTSSGSLSLIDTIGATSSYTATGLTNGVTYYFAVRATNGAGESGNSNVVSGKPTGPPSAPIAQVVDVGDGEASISWTVPASNGGSSISGYKVYRGASPTSLALVDVVGSSTLGYTDSGLVNGSTYYYAVAAYNAKGIGPKSNVLDLMPVGPPDAPVISAVTANNGSVTLGWSAPNNNGSPITAYDVLVGTSATNLTLNAVIAPTGSHTVSGLVNGTTYYFALVATNDEGDSPRSAVVSKTPASIPSGPILQSVTPGNGSATLTWTAPSGNGSPVTGFKIYRGTSAGSLTLLTTVGNVLTYTDTGLTNGTTYYYAVRAVNSIGDSIQSNVSSCTPSSTTTTTAPPSTTTPAPTTSLPPGNVNNPSYWSALGYGYCFKNDNPNTPYTLGNPPNGYYWTLLVLKAGSESSNSDWLTQIPNPLPGPYYHPSGKQISHVIYCKKPTSSTTTGPPQSTTTTTIVGDGCDNYTPTALALSSSSAEPGESVTVSGSGIPGDSLVITIKRPGYPPDTIGFAVVDGFGQFSVAVIIPDAYPPGNYTITVSSSDCACPTETTTTTSGGGGGGHHDDDGGDDDDGYWGSNGHHDDDGGDDDDGNWGSKGASWGHGDDDDGHGDDDDGGGSGGGDDDDGHGDDDDGGGQDGCDGTSKINISVTSIDLTGCGTNNYDRVFAAGETITWNLMGSPFATNKPPVTLTLVSRTPGGPSYTLYSGTYPGSMQVSVTIPAGAPIDRYFLNQTGKKSNNKVITKACPVRVGVDAVLVSSIGDESTTARSAMNIGVIGAGLLLVSTLRFRRRRPARR